MNYTRLYADSDGETHFEDVEVELAEGKVVPGGAPAQMSTPQPTTGLFFSNYHSVFLMIFIRHLGSSGSYFCPECGSSVLATVKY